MQQLDLVSEIRNHHSSSTLAEKSCVSLKWAITAAAEEEVGLISEISSIEICLR